MYIYIVTTARDQGLEPKHVVLKIWNISCLKSNLSFIGLGKLNNHNEQSCQEKPSDTLGSLDERVPSLLPTFFTMILSISSY